MDRIRNEGFQCFPSSPDAVTYRAELHGTLEASVSDLIEDITQWLSSGALISVQLQRLTIDSSCSVAITSFNENECRNTGTRTNGPSTGAVVGTTIVVIVAIAVPIAIAIIVVIIIPMS